ncbi:myb family transcription factor APL-like [Impatiens glandulifera]|uniref:myb family transcription factor APL-like n=1 Tax=Impatiens glandulifera TaxID=253017 RepID=UPI001FB05E97|nr:myb family transcription factor APL-like [Impatiens glandulifera]
MFHPIPMTTKKLMNNSNSNSNSNSHDNPMCFQGDSGLVLTTDPKPRLRWTAELHERFVDAITQLGGPDKATPKTIMRVMGVKGLTLYHLKSHLQKFRLGKQPHREFIDHSMKEASALELHQRNTASSSGIIGRSMNEMQMEVQRRLHEQLEVQRHLQLRIEAQGKYMQSILDRACQTLANENQMADQDFVPQLTFPLIQDLKLYGGDQHNQQQQVMDLHHNLDSFMVQSNNMDSDDFISLGKKRGNPNFNNNHRTGKGPLMWPDHDQDVHIEACHN